MAQRRFPQFVLFMLLFFFIIMGVTESIRSPRKLQLVDGLQTSEDSSLSKASAISSDGRKIHYEPGMVVETILDENHQDMSIYSTFAVPSEDFLYAIDSTGSQVLKIQWPIDQNGAEVARRVAGDARGQTGYVDGWALDSLFDHPKDLAVDDDGNVYVADGRNGVIRKINSEGYVTTIAGQPNTTGFADGEGKNAQFSSDIGITYHAKICTLLISDRGNRRLRKIQLKPQLDCNSNTALSGHHWKNVSIILGVSLVTSLAALGIFIFKSFELQRITLTALAQEDDNEFPLNRNPAGRESGWSFLSKVKTPVANPVETQRQAGSVPDEVSNPNNNYNNPDLIDLLDSPSHEREQTQQTERLKDSVVDIPEDAENEAQPEMPHSCEDGDGTGNTERKRNQSFEQDPFSDSESTMTGSTDPVSSLFHSHAGLSAQDGRLSVEQEMKRALHRFDNENSGST